MDIKEIKHINIEDIVKHYCNQSTERNRIFYSLYTSALNKICKISIKTYCHKKSEQSVLIKIGLFPQSNKQIFCEVNRVKQAMTFNANWKKVLPEFYETGWLTKNNAYSVQRLYITKTRYIGKSKREMFFDGKFDISAKQKQNSFHKSILRYTQDIILSTFTPQKTFEFNCLYQWFQEKSSLDTISKKVCELSLFQDLVNSKWKTCLTHGELSPRHILFLNQADESSMKWVDWEYASFKNPWPFDLIYYYIAVLAEDIGVRPSKGAGLAIDSLLKGANYLAENTRELYMHLSAKLKENKENTLIKALGLTLLRWLKDITAINYYFTERSQELLRALLYLDNLYVRDKK